MIQNERRHHRSSTEAATEVSVMVVKGEEQPVPARLYELSAGGVRVFIDQKYQPIYGLGESVYLHLMSRTLEEPLVTPAVVHSLADADEGQNISFVFVDPIGLETDVPREFAELLNQRADFRVEPDIDQPIYVQIGLENRVLEISGTLRDISVTGLSFDTELQVEYELTQIRYVDLIFALPHMEEPMKINTRIRHRHLRNTGISYGVYFVPEKMSPKNRRALSAYVAIRQRAMPQLECQP